MREGATLPFAVVASTVLWVLSSFVVDYSARHSLDVASLVLRPISSHHVAVMVEMRG